MSQDNNNTKMGENAPSQWAQIMGEIVTNFQVQIFLLILHLIV
jgi:hypothetical protein